MPVETTEQTPHRKTLDTEQQMLLEQMLLLPVPLPPQFVRLADYKGEERFLGTYYAATNGMLSDGKLTRSVSYFSVYAPLVNHPAIFFYVKRAGADLGSDDTEATHALILDLQENRIYLATAPIARRLLDTQLPQYQGELEAEGEPFDLETFIADLLKTKPQTLEEFHNIGMFEIFGGAARAEANKDAQEMREFLDQYIPADMSQIERLFYFSKFGVYQREQSL